MGILLSPNLIRALKTFNIKNAALFDGSTGYLSRTPSVSGNSKTFTYSAWIKINNLGTVQSLIAGGSDVNNMFIVTIDASDALQIYKNTAGMGTVQKVSTALCRDYAGYTHLVIAVDTTNGVVEDKFIVWVNGLRISSWSINTNTIGTADTGFNLAVAHSIAARLGVASSFSSAYQSEIHVVDGQALVASDFGEFDPVTGNWQAKSYTGTYGTNGFHLDFADNINLGKDVSGNGNNWTKNGTITQVTSTPTDVAATLNALTPVNINTVGILSNGNKTVTASSTTGASIFATLGFSSGRIRFECTNKSITNPPYTALGISQGTPGSTGALYFANGTYDGTNAYGATFTTGDRIDCEVDYGADQVEFFKNGVSQGIHPTAPSTIGFAIPQFSFAATGGGYDVRFAVAEWTGTPTAGFKALTTNNLQSRSPATPTTPQTGAFTGFGTVDNAFINLGMVPDQAGLSTLGATTIVWGIHALATATGVKVISSAFSGSTAYSIAVKAYTGGSNIAPANAQVN